VSRADAGQLLDVAGGPWCVPILRPARLALLALLLALACTDGDGAAPTVSALTIAPTEIAVGATTTVSGTFAFADADGDVTNLAVSITPPGGALVPGPVTPVAAAAGVTAGTINWSVVLAPPAAGDYVLTLGVIDDADHASNALEGIVTAR
jgi:hypothetical protein